MVEQMTSRGAMLVFIVLMIVLGEKVFAGDLYPEQVAAGLQGQDMSDIMFNDQPENSILYNDPLDDADILWFKTNIVERYGFKKHSSKDEWEKQGQFGSELGKTDFKAAADKALSFFKRNSNWHKTKVSKEFRKTGKCLELLYITAARYLLVTYTLWQESGGKLVMCKKVGDKKSDPVVIPDSVCYPEPPGSAGCTSDYDVGLIGKDSGLLIKKFNDYFKLQFDKPSENVFDVNVYAFSLEYSMPDYFVGHPDNFAKSVTALDNTVRWKMQGLVSAYYKVFKYDEGFFNMLFDTAKKTFQGTTPFTDLMQWHEEFQKLNKETPLKGIQDIRVKHNVKYEEYVKAISDRGYGKPEENLKDLAVAELYAAEAYHTRGAIRHVVGGMQMKLDKYQENKLPMMDVWTSMIENWGETMKVYKHDCFDEQKKPVIIEVCVLKISKYMWRMLNAMKGLRQRIKQFEIDQAGKGKKLPPVPFEPEDIMFTWLENYKKKGKSQVPSNPQTFNNFFVRFGCEKIVQLESPLALECMKKINAKVDIYNEALAGIFSVNHP